MRILIYIAITLCMLAVAYFMMTRIILRWYLDKCKNQMEDAEDYISLILKDKEFIRLDNIDDFRKYLKHVHVSYKPTVETMEKMASVPGEYNYRVVFSRNNDGTYGKWYFRFIVDTVVGLTGYIINADDEDKLKDIRIDTEKRYAESKKLDAYFSQLSSSLKTPLDKIGEYCDELISDENLSAEEKQRIGNEIAEYNSKLTRIISDILLFSRVHSGRQQFDYKEYEVGPMMLDMKKKMSKYIPDYLNFDFEWGRPHIFINADMVALDEMFLQYILNAVEYTRKGTIAIGWQYHLGRGLVELFVEDSGCGIDNKRQREIFGTIRHTDNLEESLGLGLNIVKSLAATMGGYITVDSKESKGSRFSIWLKAEARRNS